MKRTYRLSVEICDTQWPESALGILLPIPPVTPHQEVQRVNIDPGWLIQRFTALNAPQSAYFATFADRAWRRRFAFDLSDCGNLIEDQLAIRSVLTNPGDDARELADGLSLNNSDSDGEKLLRIIDCVGRKFKYQSGHDNDEALTCNVLTGNCLSINSAIMRLAELAGVGYAYYIGFYFKDERPVTTNDWHCWIGTLTERGYESWDVAHQLKHNTGGAIQPGLNPVPGVRFAMSVGRNLVFNLPCARVELPSLCEPKWIFPDGRWEPCTVRVMLKLIAGSRSTATVPSGLTLESAGSHAIN